MQPGRSQVHLLSYLIASILLAALHVGLLAELSPMIARDTILTLSPVNRTLLVVLTCVASVALALFCAGKTRYLQNTIASNGSFKASSPSAFRFSLTAALDTGLTLIVLWAAMSLAPQVFYTLYQWVIPGLPLQWVVSPVSLTQVVSLVNLDATDSLSTLSAGFLILVITLATVLSWLHLAGTFIWHNPSHH